MQKHITAADTTTVRVVLITLDNHLAGAVQAARDAIRHDAPNVEVTFHVAAQWSANPQALERCKADIATGDIIIVTMLFLEEHTRAILPDLESRQPHCDAIAGLMSAGEIMRLTRLGKFQMAAKENGITALLKRLRGAARSSGPSSGAKQMQMLKRLPRLLRFIPGTAQDVRAYFILMQYWLAGSDFNIAQMIRFLANRYADGPRRPLRGLLPAADPIDYPEIGVYHPDLPGRIAKTAAELPRQAEAKGTVGLIIMRAYVLADDTAHYDGVIRALEAEGYNVVPAFASGLDARPAIVAFFLDDDESVAIDALVSLTGFSLVGGPAYNDAEAAQAILTRLDVPYIAAHALEFQTLADWAGSERGLLPIEATMMVAIPEIDGAAGPMVFGGRSDGPEDADAHAGPSTGFRAGNGRMRACEERARTLARRVARLAALRRTPLEERRVAIVLFNFPPNAGGTGTAAFLGVYESLFNTLTAMKAEGYDLDVPASVDDLRDQILNGNAHAYGADSNVAATISSDDHVRREPHLSEIEAQWGPAPGRANAFGSDILISGLRLGNVLIAIQPGFGYEGDPMRLLFEKSFVPTHAFSAFYRFIREDFAANAVLHFGTHGALEFMPGKQVGLTEACWPDRLIADLPNLYLYAANNPSEGTLAKRRSAATLVSYLTPPIATAGLYKGLQELKASLDRHRALGPADAAERAALVDLIQTQAIAVDLVSEDTDWNADPDDHIQALGRDVLELEYALIPHGLHVVGEKPDPAVLAETLVAMAAASGITLTPLAADRLVAGDDLGDVIKTAGLAATRETRAGIACLQCAAHHLADDSETRAILRAIAGRYIAPAPGGDLLRTPDILPTGRNLHGFDPFRIPSRFALEDGARQADRLIARHVAETGSVPESVAIVLWGTDNLKTEGGPIGQALALMGATPRFDSYGRLSGADLIPLADLGRARIDVMMTLSGIFRDLLPLQTRMLAEAAFAAASADESDAENYIRRNARAYQARTGADLATAALRVFSNADGAYGANVNHLIENGNWEDENELADVYSKRKCFAYGCDGKATAHPELLEDVLASVDLVYQNLESVEVGVTTIDHYFDTLGGIGRAVTRARGQKAPVYIGDQTASEGKVRTLNEQVALETRTRALNPKWYEAMLAHGFEGVRQIEAHVTNTLGWSATTGDVSPWVYQQLSQTFVLDDAMRERLAALNPKASARMANRLIEAHERAYWQPDEQTYEALLKAGDELEDRLEGIRPVDAVA
jgi:magnesium chelatase subunit H